MAGKNELERFTVETINRRELKKSEYNPRKISDENRERLREIIQRNGLVAPIVVNKRNMHIVSGHQRVGVMDEINNGKDYEMQVAFIDVDEKKEKEINVALNNENAMGYFDYEKLTEIFKMPDIDVKAAGFSVADVYKVLGRPAELMNEDEIVELADKYRSQEDRKDKKKSTKKEDEYDFYCILLFESNAAREAFFKKIGREENKYVDVSELETCLKSMGTFGRQGKGVKDGDNEV